MRCRATSEEEGQGFWCLHIKIQDVLFFTKEDLCHHAMQWVIETWGNVRPKFTLKDPLLESRQVCEQHADHLLRSYCIK